MNMNYRILSALNYYSQGTTRINYFPLLIKPLVLQEVAIILLIVAVDGPYRDRAKTIYTDLRNNLIRYMPP